ANSRHPTSII
nr:Chain C, H-iCAL36 peptide [synthetic construct]4JOH_D Chain D, H-iCAL36 peptide [synthetic construct]